MEPRPTVATYEHVVSQRTARKMALVTCVHGSMVGTQFSSRHVKMAPPWRREQRRASWYLFSYALASCANPCALYSRMTMDCIIVDCTHIRVHILTGWY